MISQLDTYPMGPSMNHLFSHVENLALRRQHTTVSPAHVAHCAAGIPSFGQALLGPACGHEKIRELARRAEARLTELGCQRIATDVTLDETLHAILTAATSQAQESGAAQVGLDHFVLALLHAVEFANDFLPLDERVAAIRCGRPRATRLPPHDRYYAHADPGPAQCRPDEEGA